MDINNIYSILKGSLKEYSIPLVEEINVKSKKPFFVLIATLLSARTKDTVTKEVCERLFIKVRNIDNLISITQKDLEKLIYPVGFYKTKAKHLKQLALILKDKYKGKVPDTLEELTTLPGVGRKTANLVLAVSFNIPAICVDTHVHRIMNRIGYLQSKTALETEMILRKKLPEKLWIDTNYLFVILGQNICKPIGPKCYRCPIEKECSKKIK